jgi:hypothetical protein
VVQLYVFLETEVKPVFLLAELAASHQGAELAIEK